MDKKQERVAILLTVFSTLAIMAGILLMGRAFREASRRNSADETVWVLRSYGNGVALYRDKELSAVYGDVVLDDLPPEDVALLESGISFSTREEAEQAMEDYDG